MEPVLLLFLLCLRKEEINCSCFSMLLNASFLRCLCRIHEIFFLIFQNFFGVAWSNAIYVEITT